MWIHTWANNTPQWISTSPAWVQGVNLDEGGGGIDTIKWKEEEQILMVIIAGWLRIMQQCKAV